MAQGRRPVRSGDVEVAAIAGLGKPAGETGVVVRESESVRGQVMNQTFSKEAEKSVISSLLTTPEAWSEIGDLQAGDFFVAGYRMTFEAMSALRDRGERIDFVTVGDEMARRGTGGILAAMDETLTEIGNYAPTWHGIGTHAGIVADYSAGRRLALVAEQISKRALSGQEGIRELLTEARRALADIDTGRSEIRRVGDELTDAIAAMEAKSHAKNDH